MRKIVAVTVFTFSLTFLSLCIVSAEEKKAAEILKPADGWTLHVDAKKHVPGMPDVIVHHYCKPVSGGLFECQLYDSDKPDARLVGVEVIVNKETWEKFSKKEKALWHYHKTEIPKVDAILPDIPPDEAAKTLKNMEETYGKVYILWNPAKNEPIGKPVVSILR